MKALKWMTMVAIIFATSLSLSAQEKKGNQKTHRHMPDSAQMEKRMEKISSKLELSEKQQEEFETVLAEHKKDVQAMHEKHKPEREKERIEMDSLRSDFESDLAQILTPEQKTEFDSLKKKRKENRPNKKDCDCCCCKGKGNSKEPQ